MRLPSLPYRWELIAWLWLAFFIHQADRQVFNAVLPALMADLRLTPLQAGLVASAFTWTMAAVVPLAGMAGDRMRKAPLLAWSVFGWSAATLLTGQAGSLGALLLVRSVATGAGEAVYAPVANALMAEHHTRSRTLAISIHQTALYAGVIVSGTLAGWLAERHGWRSAFLVFGAAGVALAGLLALRLRDSNTATEPTRWGAPLARCARRPMVWLMALGFGGVLFAHTGYLTWMPTLLREKFGLSLTEAGFHSTAWHHGAALAGVLVGGAVGDRWGRLPLQVLALAVGAPFLWAMGTATSEAATYAALAAFGVCRGLYESCLAAALYDVVLGDERASAGAFVLFFAYLIGAFSPVLLGWVKAGVGLSVGLSWMGLGYGVAAMALGAGLLWGMPSAGMKASAPSEAR